VALTASEEYGAYEGANMEEELGWINDILICSSGD